jgi:hypothetical protein
MATGLRFVDHLEGALTSARRLRGKRIYSDTLRYWHEVLATASETQQSERTSSSQVDRLIELLEAELKRYPQP